MEDISGDRYRLKSDCQIKADAGRQQPRIQSSLEVQEHGFSSYSIGQGWGPSRTKQFPTNFPFMKLPLEIKWQVCHCLDDASSLVLLGSTCKRLYEVVNASKWVLIHCGISLDAGRTVMNTIPKMLADFSNGHCQFCLARISPRLYYCKERLTSCEDCFKAQVIDDYHLLDLNIDCKSTYRNAPEWRNSQNLVDVRWSYIGPNGARSYFHYTDVLERPPQQPGYNKIWLSDCNRAFFTAIGDTLAPFRDSSRKRLRKSMQHLLEKILATDELQRQEGTIDYNLPLSFLSDFDRGIHFACCVLHLSHDKSPLTLFDGAESIDKLARLILSTQRINKSAVGGEFLPLSQWTNSGIPWYTIEMAKYFHRIRLLTQCLLPLLKSDSTAQMNVQEIHEALSPVGSCPQCGGGPFDIQNIIGHYTIRHLSELLCNSTWSLDPSRSWYPLEDRYFAENMIMSYSDAAPMDRYRNLGRRLLWDPCFTLGPILARKSCAHGYAGGPNPVTYCHFTSYESMKQVALRGIEAAIQLSGTLEHKEDPLLVDSMLELLEEHYTVLPVPVADDPQTPPSWYDRRKAVFSSNGRIEMPEWQLDNPLYFDTEKLKDLAIITPNGGRLTDK